MPKKQKNSKIKIKKLYINRVSTKDKETQNMRLNIKCKQTIKDINQHQQIGTVDRENRK